MDNIGKLVYKLRQETPMIHFQYSEEGALLRATEVKPKLDRFLMDRYGEEKLKDFIIKRNDKDKGKLALNYKMRFRVSGKPIISNTSEYAIEEYKINKNCIKNEKKEAKQKLDKEFSNQGRPYKINAMYFGNMVSSKDINENEYEKLVKENYKETVYYDKNYKIEMEILCFYPKLREYIEESIDEFFFITNFGTRQSKGFGGFSIVRDNEKRKNPKAFFDKKGLKYFYFEPKSNSNASYDKLDYAMVIYSLMKSGINLTKINPEDIIKGYLRTAFLENYDKGCGSDKAFMKKNRFVTEKKGKEHEKEEATEYSNYYFIRALLGLAEHYEFKDSFRNGKVNIYGFNNNEQFDIKNLKSYELIERFQSPVTIKIIDNQIFFIFNNSIELLLDKTFIFISETKDKTRDKIDYKSLEKYGEIIKTPESFNIDEFINGFVDWFNNSQRKKLESFRRPYKLAKDFELVKGGGC